MIRLETNFPVYIWQILSAWSVKNRRWKRIYGVLCGAREGPPGSGALRQFGGFAAPGLVDRCDLTCRRCGLIRHMSRAVLLPAVGTGGFEAGRMTLLPGRDAVKSPGETQASFQCPGNLLVFLFSTIGGYLAGPVLSITITHDALLRLLVIRDIGHRGAGVEEKIKKTENYIVISGGCLAQRGAVGRPAGFSLEFPGNGTPVLP